MNQQLILRVADGFMRLSQWRLRSTAIVGVSILALYMSGIAAEAAQSSDGIEEVVVTAQKREEAVNTVPMSITAISGEALADLGVKQVEDLARAVPGFTYTESRVGTPIYTLRGVGFADIALGGRSTVGIYQDEVPVPFAIETRGANIDLTRVEVLKGPQGTMFGQNATGGAVNLVAMRPTDVFQAGLDVGLGNFGAATIGGFLSGPIADDVNARVAVERQTRNGWQRSYTTGEHMGAVDLTSGRILLDWSPVDTLRISLSLNGYLDHSESQAPQMVFVHNTSPTAGLISGLLTYPEAPEDARAADWSPGDYRRDNYFVQANLRVDYDLTSSLVLTSLSSYSAYHEDQLVDIDGMTLVNLGQRTWGNITSYFQELRVAGQLTDRAYFVLGANYANDRTRELNYDDLSESTQAYTFVGLGLPLFNDFKLRNDQNIATYAVFGNIDFNVTDALKLYAGGRYTRSINDFEGCTSDAGDGTTSFIFTAFSNFKRMLASLPPITPIAPGGCVTADANSVPQLIVSRLDEGNFSWRAGADYQIAPNSMIYANVSRGYKAGGYPTLGATATAQYDPTTQESVTAYEAGIKSRIIDNLQFNAAAFYYDYADKQVLGTVSDPSFGRLLRLINIPKSEIKGVEIQADWMPIGGLKISGSVSYLASRINGDFIAYNPLGDLQNFGGEAFPNMPKWQYQGDASYEWTVASGWYAFSGVSIMYNSSTNTELGLMPELAKKAYTLVDLRAGLGSDSGAWRVMGWIRNVGDEFYWSSAARGIDVYTRYVGMPRTYGLTLTYRYN